MVLKNHPLHLGRKQRRFVTLDKAMTNPALKFISLFAAFLLFLSCTKESVVEPPTVPDSANPSEPDASTLSSIGFDNPSFNVINPTEWLAWQDKVRAAFAEEEVDTQDFIWNALNVWYFWKEETAELDEDFFSNLQEYLDFLKGFSTPESMVDALTNSEDRFTFYNEDYSVLANSLGGISKSDGLEFGLVANDDSEDVIIYTRYVARESNAEAAGIKRGDLFNRIDGQLITRSNYVSLLNNRSDTYILGKAAQDATGAFVSVEEEVTLTQVENFSENPVLHHSIFNNGSQKVGYLVYNQFISAYNQELNEIFATFKTNAIDELVIDLRYNPGGSTAAAAVLASLIHDGSGVFAKQRWNPYWTSMFGSSLEDTFSSQISVDGATIPLNRLGMRRVYVLTQSGTASSSELLINGLRPYIEVIQIGDTTRGKNEFSITLVDDPGSSSGSTIFPYLYQSSRVDQINPNNSFALQPLVGKYENSEGFSDYTDGLVPQVQFNEIVKIDGRTVFRIGAFGTLEDGLFAKAIELMSGTMGATRAFRPSGIPAEQLREKESLMFVEFE